MAKKIQTIFQNLDKAFSGEWGEPGMQQAHVNSYDLSKGNDVIYRTSSKDDYESTKLELQQNKYLRDRWIKSNANLSVSAFAGLSNVKLMYRDADLMDSFPEIGAALDTVAEEASICNDMGKVLNIYSESDRTKAILEDLFVNRLNIQIMAPTIIRAMCKYGNQFMLLDIDNEQGVKGWRQLPVFNVERIEHGIRNPYASGGIAVSVATSNADDIDMSTQFVWLDDNNSQTPFRNWQIAHFRLMTNSLYSPYGVSFLNASRRHWRMLSLMEDMMLIYRLERSVERRVYKIFVGAIDDADVQAYIEDIANNFKRTPIVDPLTGQIDLRKNILPVHKDTPIPLLDGRTITIKELAEEYESGKENFVYSIQDKTLNVVPGKVAWCGKNYTAEKLVKITLDDDTHTIMAPEHEVLLRDGSKKRADELVAGESVMPFYYIRDEKNKNKWNRYEKVYNPSSGKYEFTHRLVGSCLNKDNVSYNTLHHKNFNKYDNNPTNLVWVDFFEHHKMHSEVAKNGWKNEEKRKIRIEKLSKSRTGQLLSEETKKKISESVRRAYNEVKMDNFLNSLHERMVVFNSLPETIEKRRESGKRRGYLKEFEEYNNSELHKTHDAIRREASRKSWEGEGRTNRIEKMNIRFDDFVWNELRTEILAGNITNRKTMLGVINDKLIKHIISINNNRRLNKNEFISRTVLENRLNENGFNTVTEYIESINKNHKVKSIEFIGGDDVYCMTVVGLNNEDDRHNFALKTWREDGSVSESGVFVRNCMDNDIFIPVRDQNAPNPIDTLSAGQNLTAMDDIKYVQKKVCAGLKMPMSFLNFEENQGEGQNLALQDVRFTRTINRIQQAFIMELTKIASIHLYLLGFKDELTNFNITMNNPSTQAEQLQIENTAKKLAACRDAVSDPGNGIPVMSLSRALKQIMHWSDNEIKENLEEIRLEKAIAQELQNTAQIIQRTGIFDNVDRIYGEPGATYQQQSAPQGEDQGMGGGGGGGMGGFGSGLDDIGAPGNEDMSDIVGAEGAEPTSEMGGGAEAGGGAEPPAGGPSQENSSLVRSGNLLNENKPRPVDALFDEYIKRISDKKDKNLMHERVEIYDEALKINQEFDNMLKELDNREELNNTEPKTTE